MPKRTKKHEDYPGARVFHRYFEKVRYIWFFARYNWHLYDHTVFYPCHKPLKAELSHLQVPKRQSYGWKHIYTDKLEMASCGRGWIDPKWWHTEHGGAVPTEKICPVCLKMYHSKFKNRPIRKKKVDNDPEAWYNQE